ncbi:MAG: hypothetical protein AB4426_04000 [Xenococcaceae cyanobacterium]
MTDLEAIYIIVLRNLAPNKYAELLPEAQEAMLWEAETLSRCPQLRENQKRQLSDALQLLNIYPLNTG